MAGDELSGFHWLDYVLFTVMLLVSLGIGIYAAVSGGKQKTTRYFDLKESYLPLYDKHLFRTVLIKPLILDNC